MDNRDISMDACAISAPSIGSADPPCMLRSSMAQIAGDASLFSRRGEQQVNQPPSIVGSNSGYFEAWKVVADRTPNQDVDSVFEYYRDHFDEIGWSAGDPFTMGNRTMVGFGGPDGGVDMTLIDQGDGKTFVALALSQ